MCVCVFVLTAFSQSSRKAKPSRAEPSRAGLASQRALFSSSSGSGAGRDDDRDGDDDCGGDGDDGPALAFAVRPVDRRGLQVYGFPQLGPRATAAAPFHPEGRLLCRKAVAVAVAVAGELSKGEEERGSLLLTMRIRGCFFCW